MMKLTHKELVPSIRLTAIQTKKFKTSLLSMTFMEKLGEETAAENALIPSVLRRGTKALPNMLAISAALDDLYGGYIEPVVRKKGETQCVGFIGSFLDEAYVPDGSSILEKAADLMAQILLEPSGSGVGFQEDYLEGERSNLVNRIRSRMNDKQRYAMYRLTRNMFEGEAYGIDMLGEEREALAICNVSLWKRYQNLIRTAALQIYYCGSASAEEVEAVLRSLLSRLPQDRCFDRGQESRFSVAYKHSEPRFFEDHMDVTQGKLVMGFRFDGPKLRLEALAPVLLLHAIYGGSTTSKLFMNVRERLSLCYYASGVIEKYKGILFVSSGIAFENYEKAKNEILAQLKDCQTGHISEEEIQNARRFIVNNLKASADGQESLEEFWLGQAVSGMEYTAEDLAQAVEHTSKGAVVEAAKELWLDSIYFLQGKEEDQ